MKVAVFAVLIIATTFLHPSSALFFHMRNTEKRCFVEEIPADTTIIGKYKIESWIHNAKVPKFSSENLGQALHVEVTGPRDALILSKMYSMEGHFAFTSYASGEHHICLQSNVSDVASSQGWGYRSSDASHGYAAGDLRVHINLRIGGKAVDYDVVKKKEKFTEIQLAIRRLMDLSDQIRKEQNYQRTREQRFRETSESTSRRVFWFAVIQTIALGSTSYWQMQNLQTFFIVKKLV